MYIVLSEGTYPQYHWIRTDRISVQPVRTVLLQRTHSLTPATFVDSVQCQTHATVTDHGGTLVYNN